MRNCSSEPFHSRGTSSNVIAMLFVCCFMISSTIALSHSQPQQQQQQQRRGLPTIKRQCDNSRRTFLLHDLGTIVAGGAAATVVGWPTQPAVAADTASYADLLKLVKQAQAQLAPIPKLIEEEKWDSVRAILIEPPLADCWARTNRPLLQNFAEALGDKGGDELAALEAKEDLVSHLRYLDMAVYNNNFNPITVEGKTGATATLLRSYYEDPINEYKASAAAINELVKLTSDL